MQMVFHCYLVAWYEGLPKAAPPLCWRDLIFSAKRYTGSLLLIHLAGGWFALRRAGQSADLWVESPALLGRQSVWANDRAQKTEAVELWLADIAAGFCKLSYSQTWLTKGGRVAKTGMNLLILLLRWEWHTQAIFTGGGTHCRQRHFLLWRKTERDQGMNVFYYFYFL